MPFSVELVVQENPVVQLPMDAPPVERGSVVLAVSPLSLGTWPVGIHHDLDPTLAESCDEFRLELRACGHCRQNDPSVGWVYFGSVHLILGEARLETNIDSAVLDVLERGPRPVAWYPGGRDSFRDLLRNPSRRLDSFTRLDGTRVRRPPAHPVGLDSGSSGIGDNADHHLVGILIYPRVPKIVRRLLTNGLRQAQRFSKVVRDEVVGWCYRLAGGAGSVGG